MRLTYQYKKSRNRHKLDLTKVALQIHRQRMAFSINDAGITNYPHGGRGGIYPSHNIFYRKNKFLFKDQKRKKVNFKILKR